jgi:hypothetical protein
MNNYLNALKGIYAKLHASRFAATEEELEECGRLIQQFIDMVSLKHPHDREMLIRSLYSVPQILDSSQINYLWRTRQKRDGKTQDD